MKKIKNKRYLLIVVALLSLIVLLSGCRNGELPSDTTEHKEVELQEGEVAIDLKKYKIIRPNLAGADFMSAVEAMQSAINEGSGVSIEVSDDYLKKGTTPDDEAYEILVGATTRPQSKESLSKINNFGYVIEVSGNKVVINGSNEMMVEEAIKAFTTIVRFDGSVLIMEENTVVDDLEFINLGSANGVNFAIRTQQNSTYNELASKVNDVVVEMAGKKTSVIFNGNTDKEIVVNIGIENKYDGDFVLAKFDASSYSIYVYENNIYINGNSYTALKSGVDRFITLLRGSVVSETDGNMKFYTLFGEKQSKNDFEYKFPEYPTEKAVKIVENNPGYLYLVTNTNSSTFDNYVKSVCDAGFDIYQQRNVSNNKFATFKNDSIVLHAYYTNYSKTVRIIAEPISELLPTTAAEPQENYTTPSVTQLNLGYTDNLSTNMGGMSYVITLKDSTFIIIDGGTSKESNMTNTDLLYAKLKELNKRPDKKIIINAWYITHYDQDHYTTYVQFGEKYGSQVTLNGVILNMPSTQFNITTGGSDIVAKTWNSDGRAVSTTAKKFGGDTKIYTPHTGQEFYIKDIKFEVLGTYEDLYPEIYNNPNDTCLVMRMTICGQTIMWAGDSYGTTPTTDAGVHLCDIMVNMWTTYLKSDIVQFPHHGYDNGGGEVWYKLVGAKVGLWSQGKHWIDASATGSARVRAWFAAGGGTKIIYAYDDVTMNFPYALGGST